MSTQRPSGSISVRASKCRPSGVAAALWLSAGVWSCSERASPREGAAALDPKPPAAAMNANTPDESADPKATAQNGPVPPSAAGPVPGDEGVPVGALDPSV